MSTFSCIVCINSSKDIVTRGKIARNCILLATIDLQAVTMDFSKLIHEFILSCYMDLTKLIYKFVCMNLSKDTVTWRRIAHNCIIHSTIDLQAVTMDFSKLIHGFILSCYMDLSKLIYKFVCMNLSKDAVTWGRIAPNCIILSMVDLLAVTMVFQN